MSQLLVDKNGRNQRLTCHVTNRKIDEVCSGCNYTFSFVEYRNNDINKC